MAFDQNFSGTSYETQALHFEYTLMKSPNAYLKSQILLTYILKFMLYQMLFISYLKWPKTVFKYPLDDTQTIEI